MRSGPTAKAKRQAAVKLRVEFERETDGRWIAEVASLPGVMVYGTTRAEALLRVKTLALRVLADRLEHGEAPPDIQGCTFVSAP